VTLVTFANSYISGLTAVTGTVIAIYHRPWLAIITSALAALSIGITRWNSLFRHRQLWVQRSSLLGELENLKMEVDQAGRPGEDRNTVAREGMLSLERILDANRASWVQMRNEFEVKDAHRVPE
jgi:hypothetical protein